MKKYKKAFLAIIILTIISISIYSNVSLGASEVQAIEGKFHDLQAPAPTGSKYVLDGGDAIFRYWNTFCIEYYQELKDVTEIEYEVKYKAEIRGQDASYFTPDGRLVGSTSSVNNSTMAAIVTPNEFIDSSICEEHRSSDIWGSTGIYGTYSAADASLLNSYGYESFSGAQLGVWRYMWDWLYYGSPEEVLNDIGNRAWFDDRQMVPSTGLTGAGAVKYSRELGLATELNVDIYFMVNDEQQDLLLVIPYGENLPEEEPDTPSIPEEETDVINVTVTKNWEDEDDRDGLRPQQITITLYADGVKKQTVTFGENDGWTYQFTDLPKTNDDGTVIAYTVKESTISGYELTNEEKVYSEATN